MWTIRRAIYAQIIYMSYYHYYISKREKTNLPVMGPQTKPDCDRRRERIELCFFVHGTIMATPKSHRKATHISHTLSGSLIRCTSYYWHSYTSGSTPCGTPSNKEKDCRCIASSAHPPTAAPSGAAIYTSNMCVVERSHKSHSISADSLTKCLESPAALRSSAG